MTVVVAVDKFKGSLTAAEAAAHLTAGLLAERPDLDVDQAPVADGGDGTLAAALAAGFERVPVAVTGPTGLPVEAAYARRGGTALVELASTCGLGLVPDGAPQPMTASSQGAGEAVRAALDAGCETLVLGLGGSASTDAGAGLLHALGALVLDDLGHRVAPGGAALAAADRVDLSRLHPRLAEVEIILASDVDNPLTGSEGAAATYGPQKGANPQQIEELDAALGHFVEVLARSYDAAESAGVRALAAAPGAGAAGGVGFAALALGATVRPGIEVVLELVGMDKRLVDASLVITGEGSLDGQSLRGKAPVGVARAAARAAVAAVAVAGQVRLTEAELRAVGFVDSYALSALEPDALVSIRDAGRLLEEVGRQIARDHVTVRTL